MSVQDERLPTSGHPAPSRSSPAARCVAAFVRSRATPAGVVWRGLTFTPDRRRRADMHRRAARSQFRPEVRRSRRAESSHLCSARAQGERERAGHSAGRAARYVA